MRRRALICSALFAALPALGQDRDGLVGLINAYRAAPGTCDGRQATSVAPLTPHPALSSVRVDTGAFLEQGVADPNVTEEEFQRFLRGIEATQRYPALLRIGNAARVTAANRIRVEKQLRSTGLSSYQADVGDFPILYAFPPNSTMLGRKLNEGSVRSEVLDLARDSNEPRSAWHVS